ncbi:MAG: O-antigen ligase family protein [Myxococcales bacterium]|nr:O-antigen ligase family protein [Myxococcales bacterium]
MKTTATSSLRLGEPGAAPLSAVLAWEHLTGPELVLGAAVVLAPLAIGGVHVASRIALAGLCLVAFAWRAWRVHAAHAPLRVGLPGLIAGVVLLAAMLQWLPLPAGLVEAIAPASAEARRLAAAAAGVEMPGWFPISADPGLTALAIVSLLGFGAAVLTAANLRPHAAVRARLIVYVELAGLATLFVGLLHSLLGLHGLYGFYRASIPLDGSFVTTFVNPNHAAALMLIGAVVAFGEWLSSARESRWHLFAGVVLTLGVVASLSRANSLLLLVSLAILGVGLRWQDADAPARRRYLRLIVGVACCAFVAVVIIGPQRWLAEFASLGDKPFGVAQSCWSVGADLARLHLGFGVGAGAFEAVAPTVMPDWTVGLVAYAHNGALQVLAELGLVFGVPVLVLVLAAVGRSAVAVRKDLVAWSALGALVVLLLQNLVDFSLWMPGVGLPAAVLVGVVIVSSPVRKRRSVRVSWPTLASAALAGLFVVASLHAWAERADAWQGDARAALDDDKPGRVALGDMLLAHPTDHYAFQLGAILAGRLGNGEAASRLLVRAQALAPAEPRILAERVNELAKRRGDLESTWAGLEELAGKGWQSLDAAIAIALDQGDDTRLSERLFGLSPEVARRGVTFLASRGHVAAADSLREWAISRFPDSLALYEDLGRRWRELPDHLERLDELATWVLARSTEDGRGADWAAVAYAIQGSALSRRGDHRRAWHMFVEAADLDPTREVLNLLDAGREALAMREYDWLDDALKRLSRLDIPDASVRADYHQLRSELAAAREDLRGAVKEMQSAIRYRPDLIGYHQRLRELFLLSRDEVSAARTAERIDALVAARDATRGRELPKKAVPSPPPGDVLHRDDVSTPAAP